MGKSNRHQLAFDIDPELRDRVRKVAEHLKAKKITQADLCRSAINEKVRDLEKRIESGEEIAVQV